MFMFSCPHPLLHLYMVVLIQMTPIIILQYQCPIIDSSLPFHFSASPTLKSDLKSVKSHRSDASAQGDEYFRQRNFKLTKQLQEYVKLDRFFKQENVVLKAKVASLQTLVDDITIGAESHSYRKSCHFGR